jgi:hypothetical protein
MAVPLSGGEGVLVPARASVAMTNTVRRSHLCEPVRYLRFSSYVYDGKGAYLNFENLGEEFAKILTL